MTPQSANPLHILSAYGQGPGRLESALTGLSQAGLDATPPEGGWSIRMIVHHLADGDALWTSFIKQALGGAGGEFMMQWYWAMPQDEWAKRWNYATRPIGGSLALFGANRVHVSQLLHSDPGVLDKTLFIRWPKGDAQEVSVHWVVEMQTQHVEQHVADIARIRESL